VPEVLLYDPLEGDAVPELHLGSEVRRPALLFLVFFLAVGCSSSPILDAIARPEIKDLRARIAGLDFQGVNLVFDVDVANPYPVAIRTPRFKYGIEVAGTSIMTSDTTTTIDLPASGIGTTSLPVRVRYADLFKLYQNLSGVAESDYKLTGALVLRAMNRDFELPLSHAGTFPILKIPTFTAVDVKPSEVTMTRAAITVEAEIGNPNIFALGLEGLGYGLALGEIQVGGLKVSTGDSVEAGGTGALTLTGEISAVNAVIQLLMGGKLGAAQIRPRGFIKTPYGRVALQ
jgi:LEA14-like dessication related protein